MSLIKCPECGKEISDLAASCPHCGCPVNTNATTQAVTQQTAVSSSAKKGASITIILVSITILILTGAAIWFLFFRGGTDADERNAYDNIMRYENNHQLDSLSEALNDYFDTYNSDAFHYSQLKELHDRFFTERADWQAAEGLTSVDAVLHFLDVHPDGFYQIDANQKLDSLSYVEACRANTCEAYEQYLSQFFHGKFAAEAKKQMAALDNVELTIEEKTSIKETLTAHFDALADNDKGSITTTLASEVSSYIGKANPELEDIYAYMSNMHSSGRNIVFNVKNMDIKKVDAAGHNLYNVQFDLEEEIYTRRHSGLDTEAGTPSDDEKASDVQQFKGTAVLNEEMKITSLVLRK